MKNSILILLLLVGMSAYTQDRYFGQTYTSNILPKGSVDLELWHTSRFGHEGQFFHAMDQRMELEVGLGKNVQTAFYFNHFQKSFSNNTDEIVQETENGFSNEWKWKLSDPSKNKIGTALYAELGVKGDELELETKLILDKSFDKNLLAFNLTYEIEKEAQRKNGKNTFGTSQTPLILSLAYMYNISTSLGLGAELRNNNTVIKGNWQNSILFGGPCINYRGDRWFVVVNYLPQWVNLRKTSFYPLGKVLNDYERNEARVIVGYSF